MSKMGYDAATMGNHDFDNGVEGFNKVLPSANFDFINQSRVILGGLSKNTNKVHESADVLYHLLVYLEANNIKIEDVMSELDNRKK